MKPVAVLEEGPGGPLSLDQNEARKAEIIFFGDYPAPPFYLRVWMTATPPPPSPSPLISSSGSGTGNRLTFLFKIKRGVC